MNHEITEPEATENGPIPYEILGGETALHALVTHFYDLMALCPEYAELRRLHPPALEGSRDKLFMFLSGWLGGPNLYIARYGHPRLRARHLPYPIGETERDQWLACMAQAMQECGVPDPLRQRLAQSFAQTADWMRNKEG